MHKLKKQRRRQVVTVSSVPSSAYSPVSLIARNNLRCHTSACTVIISRRNLLQREDSLPLAKSITFPEITWQSVWPVMRRLVLETCASITTCFISVLFVKLLPQTMRQKMDYTMITVKRACHFHNLATYRRDISQV